MDVASSVQETSGKPIRSTFDPGVLGRRTGNRRKAQAKSQLSRRVPGHSIREHGTQIPSKAQMLYSAVMGSCRIVQADIYEKNARPVVRFERQLPALPFAQFTTDAASPSTSASTSSVERVIGPGFEHRDTEHVVASTIQIQSRMLWFEDDVKRRTRIQKPSDNRSRDEGCSALLNKIHPSAITTSAEVTTARCAMRVSPKLILSRMRSSSIIIDNTVVGNRPNRPDPRAPEHPATLII
ncbi:hypothetical protein C8R43DRAFT_942418 [Mycena crocata]|nr:hypothetical protein C8R43DRAFT_942418 [Mycena crocata]